MADYSLDDLRRAFKQADDAGDTETAQVLADKIRATTGLSKGVKANGMIPGDEPTLDLTKAGQNWSTFQIQQDGTEKHWVLPTRPSDNNVASDETGFRGDAVNRFIKEQKLGTPQHYGAFDTDKAGQDYMAANGGPAPTDLSQAPRAGWGGYGRTVRNAMAGSVPPADATAVHSDMPLGPASDLLGGAATGIPAMMGFGGDFEGITRAAANLPFQPFGMHPIDSETFLPTQQQLGNMISGEPQSVLASIGRQAVGLVGPAAITKGVSVLARAGRRVTPSADAKEMHGNGFYVLPSHISEEGAPLSTQLQMGEAGQTKIEQEFSIKNTKHATALTKDELGIGRRKSLASAAPEAGSPPGGPLKSPFETLRASEGQAYSAVANALPEGETISLDTELVNKINAIGNRTGGAQEAFKDVPGVSNDKVEALKSGILTVEKKTPPSTDDFTGQTTPGSTERLPRDGVTPAEALQFVRIMREEAAKGFKSEDPAALSLAAAQRSAADAMDEFLVRKLPKGVAERYQAARTTIAQSYDAESATNETTGMVDGRVFGRMLKAGAPLSGNFLKIARAARMQPRAFQDPSIFGGKRTYSFGDLMLAGYGGLRLAHGDAGGAAIMAGALGRPAMRSYLTSERGQRAIFAPQTAPPLPIKSLAIPALASGLSDQAVGTAPPLQ